MITLIHGSNTAASRTFFSDIKAKAENPITITYEKFTQTDFAQILEGQGLFAESKNIFIEELLSKKKQIKDMGAIVAYLNAHHTDHTIYLWESKELTPKQANSFTGSTQKKFDLPKSLFAFLDSLLPKNGKQAIKLFHECLVVEDADFLLFMIVRQFRILLALSEPSNFNVILIRQSAEKNLPREDPSSKPQDDKMEQIDEVARLAPWQKGKLTRQSHAFGKETMLQLYSQLFAIECGMKTGTLPQSIIATIDFFLLSL